MSAPPRRYKTAEELTAEEHLARERAARQGKPTPMPETDEYREARAEALERAGFEAEATPIALEDMSVDDHINRRDEQ